ncbi:MAG: DUF302 domain-containing protein [Ignavibacteria bacterium]|nr:DUF302 domain-containing protein [Ignavibacteria bacterium]
MTHTNYGFTKIVPYSFDEAVVKATEALKDKGFGVLTEIDVKATMKKKLDEDMKPYRILGACNPGFAFKALQSEEQAGLMLPCNVIVYVNKNDETVVSAVDPIASMKAIDNHELGDIAGSVQNLLKEVIEKL